MQTDPGTQENEEQDGPQGATEETLDDVDADQAAAVVPDAANLANATDITAQAIEDEEVTAIEIDILPPSEAVARDASSPEDLAEREARSMPYDTAAPSRH